MWRKKAYWFGVRPWNRHGLVLTVAGWLYVFLGLANIYYPPSGFKRKALRIALTWMPLEYWGGVFVLVGLLAIISARWPPIASSWGYSVLTGISAGWAAFYLMGIIFDGSPASNVSYVFVWGILGFMWWAISGLVNPGQVPVMPNECS